MKNFNFLKLINSFKEISNALEIIAVFIKLFAIGMTLFQAVSLISRVKKLKD